MKPLRSIIRGLCVLSISLPWHVLADEGHEETGTHHHDSILHIEHLQVMGEHSQFGILNSVPNVSTLHGDELFKKSQTSLGETLQKEAGINSTQFGPSASRPVIRGLEGDRIRILQNGIGILDASGTSQDHAVPVNPLSAESIEVVRGPINLLYGSSAIGGVVNIVNSRIHKSYFEGFSGGFDLKGDSVNSGSILAAKMDYGFADFMVHADADYSKASDLRVPGKGRIANSENNQMAAALGTTYFFTPKNYLGLSFSGFQNKYGVVAEPDVDIDLKQQRLDLSSSTRLSGFFRALQVKSAQTFYKHQELEGDVVGTTFKNTGNESRVELIQNESDWATGIWGLQFNSLQTSALGEEAFLPTSQNMQSAVFVFEEFKLGENDRLNLGVRGEYTDLRAEAGVILPGDEKASFFGGSVATGYLHEISDKYFASAYLSYNERAPTYQELYANGPHMAVGVFEQGDRNLQKERSVAAELSLRKKSKKLNGRFSLFTQKFANFVSLSPTGTFADTDDSGIAGDSPDDFQIFNYLAQEALFYGAEIAVTISLGAMFDLEFTADTLRGKNPQSRQNLPRISPMRLGTNFIFHSGSWSANIEGRFVDRQTLTAPLETSTPDYFLVNLGADYDIVSATSRWSIYLQANNLTDRVAINHVSLIKDRMQLPGRGFVLGVRSYF